MLLLSVLVRNFTKSDVILKNVCIYILKKIRALIKNMFVFRLDEFVQLHMCST